MKFRDKIEATIKKFEIWAIRVEKNSFSNFPTLQSFLESSCECLSQEVKSEISEHLLSMAKILRKYFHQLDPNNTWIRNPFHCDIEKIENLSEQEQDELIDLVTNGEMKNIFDDKKLIDFWLIVQNDQKQLAEKALRHLIPFCTTYRLFTKKGSADQFKNRPKDSSKPKSCACVYKIIVDHVDKVVCKKAFCYLFGINKSRVERIIKSLQNNLPSPEDKRGKHTNRGNSKSDQVMFQLETHIRSFPAHESHYSRKENESVRYLSPYLNVYKMYELYMLKFENENWQQIQENENIKPNLSYDFYRKYFLTNFKLSFGYPRSDTCQLCDKLHNLIKVETNEELKNKLKTEKQLHLSKAEVFYTELKQKTIESKDPNNKCEVLSFDYQQNMPLPHIPSGDVYYKRQLWVYNFCIHSGKTEKSYFYMYDEATGRKGQNEVINFLNHFFCNIMDKSVETEYLFSDNCSAQNKNFGLTQYLYTLALTKKFGIKTIQHRWIPQPGHSFLPCDRDFALIEKNKRKQEYVFLLATYQKLVKDTCKSFNVIDVKQDTLLNYTEHIKPFFKKIVKHFSILSYRFMEYTKNGLYASISVHSTAKELFILHKPNSILSLTGPSFMLYNSSIKIIDAKLKDVRDLASKYVPPDNLWFYNSHESNDLPINEDSSDE
ncbi:hypothetical protein ACI65C_013617 [Semiaphis heraclei]